jgi:DinB family protein
VTPLTRTSPDPITQAAAYQQLLLSLLGDDDPVQVQGETAGQVGELVRRAGADLRQRPAANEWSVAELVAHLFDAEIVMSARYRWALSQDRPQLIGYDQDAWVERLHRDVEDPDDLLAVFSALREANRVLWRRTAAADRQRVGIHAERGAESYELMFRMIAGHDRFHLDQMRKTLAQVRNR